MLGYVLQKAEEVGKPNHEGDDCYILRRDKLEQVIEQLGDVFLGFEPIGCEVMKSIAEVVHPRNRRVICTPSVMTRVSQDWGCPSAAREFWTFHVGNSKFEHRGKRVKLADVARMNSLR